MQASNPHATVESSSLPPTITKTRPATAIAAPIASVAMLREYSKDAIVEIEDVTRFVHAQHGASREALRIPLESVYPVEPETAALLRLASG